MAVDGGALILEREVEMVRGAIDLVAGGRVSAVTLAGLQFGEALVEVATGMARRAGVRVIPLWSADDARADIRVERREDA